MLEPKLVKLPKISDLRGSLSFLQRNDGLPFEINTVSWIYDIPSGQFRNGQAYANQYELVIALSGSFFVKVCDEKMISKSFYLNTPDYAVLLPPLTWSSLENFSTNSISLHCFSDYYSEKNIIQDFDIFKIAKIERNKSI